MFFIGGDQMGPGSPFMASQRPKLLRILNRQFEVGRQREGIIVFHCCDLLQPLWAKYAFLQTRSHLALNDGQVEALLTCLLRGTQLVTRPLLSDELARKISLIWRRGTGRREEFRLLAKEHSARAKMATKPEARQRRAAD